MSKRLGGIIIGCKYKTSARFFNGLPDGINSNFGSTDSIIPGRNSPLCCTLTLIIDQAGTAPDKNKTKTFLVHTGNKIDLYTKISTV